MEESFYCGDAAGRKQKPFNDHSDDDMCFAIKLQLRFFTPEMLFLDSKLNYKPPMLMSDKNEEFLTKLLDKKYLKPFLKND